MISASYFPHCTNIGLSLCQGTVRFILLSFECIALRVGVIIIHTLVIYTFSLKNLISVNHTIHSWLFKHKNHPNRTNYSMIQKIYFYHTWIRRFFFCGPCHPVAECDNHCFHLLPKKLADIRPNRSGFLAFFWWCNHSNISVCLNSTFLIAMLFWLLLIWFLAV